MLSGFFAVRFGWLFQGGIMRGSAELLFVQGASCVAFASLLDSFVVFYVLGFTQMKISFFRVSVIVLLAPLLAFNAAAESEPDQALGPRLSDCGAFFGLLSRAQSQYSEVMRAFAYAATSYAVVAGATPQEAEASVGRSMVRLGEELPILQKDSEAFRLRYALCLSTLKAAEPKLRPRLDEVTKALVPELFPGNQ